MSVLTSGLPLGPGATSGSALRMLAASRPTPLEISLSAPTRMTIALSGEPLSTSAAWKPEASAKAPTRIITTIAMPQPVASVVMGRWTTLRKL
jgi:hypothetical protein